MSRQLAELENVLRLLVEEHKRMLSALLEQQEAMKALQLQQMQDAMHRQETSRLRISSLDHRRRLLVQQLAKAARLAPEATVTQIAQAFPQTGTALLELRDQLRALIGQISERTHVAGRLAAAFLGHLNTAIRLLADAVGQAGTYTRHGVPRVSARIGVMEAVG